MDGLGAKNATFNKNINGIAVVGGKVNAMLPVDVADHSL